MASSFEVHVEIMGETRVVKPGDVDDFDAALTEALDLLNEPLVDLDEGQVTIRVLRV